MGCLPPGLQEIRRGREQLQRRGLAQASADCLREIHEKGRSIHRRPRCQQLLPRTAGVQQDDRPRGWGGRTEKHGPYVYYDDAGKVVRNTQPGRGGSHGPQHAFKIITRDTEHPVTKGMPKEWLHAQDELYDSLRGPAESMDILATAYSNKSKRHEPMMMIIKYGKGLIFHTPMGHENGKSLQCVGFIATMNRAAEWLATGKVTQDAAEKTSQQQRKFHWPSN